MIRKFPARGALCAAVVTALTAMPGAFGQTAESKPNATDKPSTSAAAERSSDLADDQIVVLSPFTVTTGTEGYQAVDTLGGARVKTKLEDTASSLSVITKAMMNDAGMTNAQDLLLYSTNTEIAGLHGNFSGVSSRGAGVSGTAEASRLLNPGSINRSRGLTAMDNTRNYFQSEIPWDSYNISRVDISRGPNSFLFGVGSPSGISNYSTNEAVFKNQGDVQFRVGSFGSHRESVDYNRVFIPRQLAARVDFVNDDTQFQQKPAFNHTKRLYGAITYEPEMFAKESSHLKLQANGEIGRVRSNNPRTLPPVDMITGYFSGGGLNKGGYDPFIYNTGQQLTGIGSFNALNPWINAQDYHYAWPGPAATYWYDAATGKMLQAMTTLNGSNNGNSALSSTLPQTAPLYISGFSNFAKTMDSRFPNSFPGAAAGTVTYNDKSLSDTSVFDFYNKLIDGPNKREWQNWNSFNVTAEETLFNGRVALQGVVDRQDFDQGQVGIYGYTAPWISVDMDANQIIYPSALTSLVVPNTNVGRAFTAGDFGSSDSSSHVVRNNYQLTANVDLRAEDIMEKGKAAKIVGRHSLTGLYGQYNTNIETRAWNGAATDTAFAALMGDPTGSLTGNRGIQWVSYLGPSMRNASSASGQNLSNLATYIQPRSGVVKHFNNTWNASGVNASDPWANPVAGGTNTQQANPANYVGWTNVPANVLNWENNIDDLYTSGSQTEQKLRSMAFMYQGYLVDDMIIPSWGWRRDKVSQRSSNAPLDVNTHLASMNYGITGLLDEVTTTSTSAGIALHLPKSLRGKLPLGSDVSLYYFRGNNQTPRIRYGFDANRLPSEEGRTDDYSVRVDTLDGRVTVRLTYFKTIDKNGAAGSGAADPLGNNGYYLYLLPAWGAADAAMSGMALSGTMPYSDFGFTNNTGGPAAVAAQAAAVADFRANFAKYFPQAFFDAYGLGVNVNAISSGNYAYVYNNPTQQAFPWNIANTGSGKINGSYPIITQDITAKGYELEVTMRPTSNWDITFNASKVSAVQTALGQSTIDFIEKQYEFFKGPAGVLPLWGYWGGPGGGSSTLYSYFMQNIYSAYLVQKSQHNAEQPELRKWNLKGIANYSFKKGALKGLNIGGGIRWASKPILGYGISQVKDPAGNLVWLQDVNKPLYGSVDQHADLWVGYQCKLSDKVDWRIQLNLQNVGEKSHLKAASILPDGTYAQKRIMQGQTWQVTNKLMF